MSSRRVCKTSWNYAFKTSSKRLQDVLEDKSVLYWRRLQYVFTKANVCWDMTKEESKIHGVGGDINRWNRIHKWPRGYSKCIHVYTREIKGQKISHKVLTNKIGWTLTVPLRDIPELLILKIFSIVRIYTSKFFLR